MAIDTLERRATIHSSVEIAAAKHLARAYGLSMRRQRRVGAVTYLLGNHFDGGAYGNLRFSDGGALSETNIFGMHEGAASLLELAAYFEFGNLRDSMLFESAAPLAFLEFETPITDTVFLTSKAAPQYGAAASPTTQPVPLVVTPPSPYAPKQGREVRVVRGVLASAPRPARAAQDPRTAEAVTHWTFFLIGVALVAQFIFPVMALLSGIVITAPQLLLSVVGWIVGLATARTSFMANEERTAAVAHGRS